jgi:signal transduction histidine kinase
LIFKVLLPILPVAVLILVGVTYASSHFARQTVLEQVGTRLKRDALQARVSVGRQIQTVVQAAEALASNDLVINGIVDFEGRAQYLETFFQSLRIPGQPGARITLTDYRGRVLAQNRRRTLIDYRDNPGVRAAMRGVTDRHLDSDGIRISAPVMYFDNPEGVVIIEYDAAQTARLMLPASEADLTVIIGAGDVVLSSSDPDAVPLHQSFKPLDDATWIHVRYPVPAFIGLSVLEANETKSALKPISELTQSMIGMGLLGLCALVGSVFLTAYRATQPLTRMTSSIQEIGARQDLSRRVDLADTAELHHLGNSFNLMLEQLCHTTTSRDYVDGVLNSLSDAVLVVDREGIILDTNQAAIARLGECIGKPIGRYLDASPGQRTDMNRLAPDAGPTAAAWSDTVRESTDLLVTVTALQENLDTEADRIYLVADVGHLKEIERDLNRKTQELTRSNAELERFASIASHDLQEPLRKIRAFGERLQARSADHLPPRDQNYLNRMLEAAGRMQHLIEDLLNFSRVAHSMRAFESVDLDQVARDVVSDLESRITETGGAVDIGPLGNIEADPTQMRQLLQNLIGNALKFHREDVAPRVVVRATEIRGHQPRPSNVTAPGSLCVLTVQDNGIGFQEKYLHKIFEVFQRLHGRGDYEGTGIGLAICRRIAEHHGGSIDASSVEGQGTCFTIVLPATLSHQESQHVA